MVEVERGRKSVEAALGVVKRQAEKQHGQLQSAKELGLAKEKIELQWKEFEGK